MNDALNIEIVEVETGKHAVYSMEITSGLEEQYANVYMWENGNFSCDCNRILFLAMALGEGEEGLDIPCSEGRFLVQLQLASTGEILFTDKEFVK